ncbi:hypothetical protein [Kribbella sp. NPDC006257]|uniref:hypothetical protein n=1 Tax=Kribbella sp. NPDC006257 TaxID=3156738 RepID=UPI0033B544C8
MRFRPAVALVGALVLGSGAVVVTRLAGPADAALAPVEGRLLASDPDPAPQGYQFESVSNEFFTFRPGLPSESRPQPWQIRSTADGSVASSTPSSDPYWRGDELAGRSKVTRTTTDAGVRIALSGLAGASSPGSLTVPAADTILVVHEKGVLVRHDDGGSSELRIFRFDGTDQLVTGLVSPDNSLRVTDSDGSILLLQSSDRLHTLDLGTAVATPVVQSGLGVSWAALTPGRIVWETGTSASGHQLTWKNRDGSPGGDVTVPDSEDLTTFGDDVAVLRIPAGGSSLRREIVPVPLATGKFEAPVIDDVAAARALSDGRLLLIRTDAVLALKPDLTRTKLADIAAPVLGARDLVVSGGRVLKGFDDGSARETTLTATNWTQFRGPSAAGRELLQLGGGTVLSRGGLVVSWPGGQRALPNNGSAELGRGGKLLSYISFDDQSTASIQNPRTGAVLATRPTARVLAMDGTWVWQGPDPVTHALTGTDLSTGTSKTVPTAVPCPAGTFQVAGRWALVTCDLHQLYAIDLLGVVADYRLPDNAQSDALWPALGDGFVARLRVTTNAAGTDIPELLVTDLNSPAHPERVVGPLQGRISPPGPSFALDDEAPRIVYADPESQVRVAAVDWLAAPPPVTRVDSTAPKLSSAAIAGGRIVLTTPIRFSYAFTDDRGVASYDVAYRSAPAGKTYGAWVYPAGWQKIKGTSVTTTPQLGADTCLMVRARDGAGNVSAWSAPVCSELPQDDRAFTSKGSVSRTTYASAYRTTLSRLGASGASLSKAGEAGNRIAVTILAGPSQGTVEVTFAGRKIGRVSLAASTWSRKVVYLPVTPWLTGTVVVTSVSSLPSNVDAVSLLR